MFKFNPDLWHLPNDPMLGFIEIPAGPFLMGSSDDDQQAYDDEKPQHTVELPTYYMARWPVTNAQFHGFIEDTNYKNSNMELGQGEHPMVNVSYHDAMAYCEWLNKRIWDLHDKTKISAECMSMLNDIDDGTLKLTIPSEAEWEKAARGTDGHIYPWGDGYKIGMAADYQSCDGLRPVTERPYGASPYGCEDMSGNVWEWTRSIYTNSYKKHAYKDKFSRVLRGGASYSYPYNVRAAFRNRYNPENWHNYIGVRVVVSSLVSDR